MSVDQLALFDPVAEDDELDPTRAPVYDIEEMVEAAFAYFRSTGFPYKGLPMHVIMQEVNRLAQMPTERLWTTLTANGVADTYHPQRYHARAVGMRSPYDAYLDDELLRRALRLHLGYGQMVGTDMPSLLGLVRGTQACGNFRPGAALALYRSYAPDGGVLLDTSMGYGGRLVGFAAWQEGVRYLGVDPSVDQYLGNQRLADALGVADRVHLVNKPAEDVAPVDLDQEPGTVDLAFTSPPYFGKELYSEDDNQSWRRYPEADGWRRGFLEPMLRLHALMLRPGAYTVVNIAPVKIGSKTHDLPAWTLAAGIAAGLMPETAQHMLQLRVRYGRKPMDDIATEPFIVFQKPADWRGNTA